MASRIGPEGPPRETKEGLDTRTPIIVAGLPGKMATAFAEAVPTSDNYFLQPVGLSSIAHRGSRMSVHGEDIPLVRNGSLEWLRYIKNTSKEGTIVVDYTIPAAVNDNARFYVQMRLPFVMGTTGGDRQKLEETVRNSKICAVIAPNMAPQIVAFQSLMAEASERNPGLLENTNLDIVESHQKGKRDTSGTARAMVRKADGSPGYFNLLGITFKEKQIVMVREPEEQLKLGVPESALEGHGWHTYIVTNNSQGYHRGIRGIDLFAEKMGKFLVGDPVFSTYRLYTHGLGTEQGIITNLSAVQKKLDRSKLFPLQGIHRVAPDGSVSFSVYYDPGRMVAVTHNVNGRSIYVQGTFMALEVLQEAMAAGRKGEVLTMINDVLPAQAA